MSTVLSIDDTTANDALDVLARYLDGGTIVIYSGTAPANIGVALSGNTPLATFTISSTSAAAASGRSIELSLVASIVTADATGTASFWRAFTSGAAGKLQGSVGTSGNSLNLTSTALTDGGNVEITSAYVSIA